MINETYEVKLIGKTYEINKDILVKIPIIKTMLKDFSDNKSKVISINRSSLLFDHVIAYVIDDTYPYPLKYFNELDYYDIIYDKSKLYDPHKNSNDKLELLSKNIIEINDLTVKIYDLENKIENITINTYNDVTNEHECNYFECSAMIVSPTFYCDNHKDLFMTKCSYRNPIDKKLCPKDTDDKSKYCLDHIKVGKFCNKKNCDNIRRKNSEICFNH